MKHPDIEYVKSIVKSILAKRRFADWKVGTVTFTSFSGKYSAVFSNQNQEKTVSLVSELFDDIQNNDGPMTRRKVKKLIQSELLPGDTGDDD